MTAEIVLPPITMHAVDDPAALVTLEEAYHDLVHEAGNGDLLVQVFTDEAEPSKLSDPQYPALVDWVEGEKRPTLESMREQCEMVGSASRGRDVDWSSRSGAPFRRQR